MVWLQPPPLSGILINIILLVTCIWYLRLSNHSSNDSGDNITHVNYDKTKRTNIIPFKHQSDWRDYVASLATQGTISHKESGMRNWPLTSSVGVQCTRCHYATSWTIYTFICPIQKTLMILEVWKWTKGQTMNWNRNLRFNPSATRVTKYSFIQSSQNWDIISQMRPSFGHPLNLYPKCHFKPASA